MRNWIILGLLIGVCHYTHAQTDRTDVVLKGQILNIKSHEPIAFVNIYLKKAHKVFASNYVGEFNTLVDRNDTLLFTSIGYEDFEITIHDYIKSGKEIIYMLPIAYTLKEVEIRAMPTYQQLKLQIANAEASFEEKQMNLFYENLEKLNLPDVSDFVGMPDYGMAGPYIVLFSIGLSKNSKSRSFVNQLKKIDKKQKKVRLRFNQDIIRKLTGLKDEKIIKQFMEYCAFTDQFILESSIFELYNLIAKRFLAFKKEFGLS